MYTPKVLKYCAAEAAFYEVATQEPKTKATGNMLTVSNPDRKWFQFWKPKQIQTAEYVTVSEWSGKETFWLEKGECIETTVCRKLKMEIK